MSDCNCSICADTINNPITTYCNHTYCSECLKEWHEKCFNNRHDMPCPLCRTLLWKYTPQIQDIEDEEFDYYFEPNIGDYVYSNNYLERINNLTEQTN